MLGYVHRIFFMINNNNNNEIKRNLHVWACFVLKEGEKGWSFEGSLLEWVEMRVCASFVCTPKISNLIKQILK